MSNIKREAAYMYLDARKLLKLNEKIKKASVDVHLLQAKVMRTTDPYDKLKRHKEYEKATKHLHELSAEHNEILIKLRHHHLNFEHFLRVEHNAPK